MATTNLPVSTRMWHTFIERSLELLYVVLGNPLSIAVLNLLSPQLANQFVNWQRLFGEEIRGFYTKIALKMPFYWAKWWMRSENMLQYSIKRQIKYFLKVSFKQKTEVETLKAMRRPNEFWPDVYETLFFKYGNKKLPISETRSRMHGECMVAWTAHFTVREFIMRHARLSWYALQAAINQAKISDDMYLELKRYLASGKLNSAQFKLLVDGVTTSNGSGDLQMLGILLDYVKRYGISDTNLSQIEVQYPQPFFELVKEAVATYSQAKAAKKAKPKQ